MKTKLFYCLLLLGIGVVHAQDTIHVTNNTNFTYVSILITMPVAVL